MLRELAQKIMDLYHNGPDMGQVLLLLNDYDITKIDRAVRNNYQMQVAYFLGAKQTEGLSARTIGNYKLYLTKFGEFLNKRTEDITTNDIRYYITSLGEKGLKKTSIQAVINILRSYFSWMTMEEIIPKNPMLRIRSFKIDKKQGRHPLTPEEFERLRDACNDYREKALIEFLYSTGCRISEAASIDLQSIDFDRRTVNVVGKGDKQRTLYFSVRARLMIQAYVLNRKGGEALFAGKWGRCLRLSTRELQYIVQRIGKRAGLSRRVHPHLLRHTFATNALHAGMDITVIQQILGHSSLDTTRIYAETDQDHVRQQHDRFVA